MESTKKFFAHSLEGEPPEKWQPLEEHLKNVAELASQFAVRFGGDNWAYLAGLWHDLGKYSPAFQAKLFVENGIKTNLMVKGPVIHSEAGGHLAALKGWPGADRVLSWLIMGHHAGLTDYKADKIGPKALEVKLRNPERSHEILQNVPKWLKEQPPVHQPIPKGASPSFYIRMLFSCLVDADYLDTEAFMDKARSRKRAHHYPQLNVLNDCFLKYMKNLMDGARDSKVNQLRKEVFYSCLEKAQSDPNIFSLTVPTGGGKTLSSLAFALNHAVKHEKQRIIYVIPYTNIIEQTADTFRKIPGFEEVVLEHHSNLVEDDSEADSRVYLRLASENWDAPIIVTTAVQFFESIYSCKPSRCRRLHNIINSVVIFDEAQCMPSAYLRPIISAIKELFLYYNVTPIFCTATQPVLVKSSSIDFTFPEGLEKEPTEIAREPERLNKELKRVKYALLNELEPIEIEELAENLARENSSFLCIMNLKEHAREVARLLEKDNVFHLSTNMCPDHRRRVLRQIRELLQQNDNQTVKVISTSLVEAGVDLDFPLVFRALAGLDSIIQAAGRCNREGRLAGLGKVVIFKPSKQPVYVSQPAAIAEEIIKTHLDKLDSISTVRTYFHRLYWQLGHKAMDQKDILMLLGGKRLDYYFRTASERFKLIDDRTQVDVLVPYGDVYKIISDLEKQPWNYRRIIRKLQRFSISIYQDLFEFLGKKGLLHHVAPKGFQEELIMLDESLYHPIYGLLPPGEAQLIAPEDLII